MSADPDNQQPSAPPQTERTPPAGAYPPPYWYPPPAERYDEISLADLWSVVASNKWHIVVVTLLCTVLAVAYAILATPIFRAETLLAPVEKQSESGLSALAGRFGGLADLAGISLPRSGDVETALATLRSREFIIRFIGEEQLKPVLFSNNWNADTQSWTPPHPLLAQIKGLLSPEGAGIRDPNLAPGEPTDWDAYESFSEEVLAVSSDSKTGLVVVAVEWEDPQLAARWANLLVERLNAEVRQQAIDRAQQSIEYLRQQIEKTSLADLRAVLFRLIEEHTKTITLARVNEEYVFQVIDPAVAPQEKTKPRRTLIAAAGIVIGVMLGVMLAFFRGVGNERRSEPVPS